MPPRSDPRRLRLYRIDIVDSGFVEGPGADVWMEDGRLKTSGLWEGFVPSSAEDVEIQAKALSVSPIEWLRRKLSGCSFVRVEVM